MTQKENEKTNAKKQYKTEKIFPTHMKISLKLINKMNNSREKWAQNRIRPFTENETEVSLKHMKKMLNLSQRELQIKTLLGFCFSSLRMTYSEIVAGWQGLEKH